MRLEKIKYAGENYELNIAPSEAKHLKLSLSRGYVESGYIYGKIRNFDINLSLLSYNTKFRTIRTAGVDGIIMDIDEEDESQQYINCSLKKEFIYRGFFKKILASGFFNGNLIVDCAVKSTFYLPPDHIQWGKFLESAEVKPVIPIEYVISKDEADELKKQGLEILTIALIAHLFDCEKIDKAEELIQYFQEVTK